MFGIIRSSKGSGRRTHLSPPQLKCRYTKGIKAPVLVIDKCLPAKAISHPQCDSPSSSFDIIIPSSSTSEEKFICVWGFWQSPDDRKFKWYALPLDDDLGNKNNFGFGGAREVVELPGGKVANKIEPFSEARLPRCATTVAFGSTIYSLGGLAYGTGCDAPDLKFFDTNHPERGWMVGPPMAFARVEPWAGVLHGKIYVLFGLVSSKNQPDWPWMEVFDPRTMEWTTLKSPLNFPPYLRSFHAFGSDQIFVDPKEDSRSGSDLYLCFDVEERKWKTFNDETLESGPPGHPDLSLREHCPEPVVHERTLYWYLGTELFAYDLEAKKWFCSISIEGLEAIGVPQLWRAKLDPRLFHLDGDLFCLLWQDKKRVHDNESDESLLPLHCTKVRVSKTGSNFTGGCGFLSAYVVSSRSFLVECGIPMGGAVLVDRKLDEEQKLADTLELGSKNSSQGLHDGVLGTTPGGALAAGAMHLFRRLD